jgi:type IV pilus assembly protein PilV
MDKIYCTIQATIVFMEHRYIVIKSTAQYVGAFPSARRINTASGFSLIEVLVSIVVLSFVLLGMVGMQTAALQANREARYQSAALFFGRELAEMIRGDKVEGIKPTATNPYLGTFSFPLTHVTASYCLSVATGTTACGAGSVPVTTDIANAEMTDWLSRVNYDLPSAKVVICYDDAPFDANGLPQWACSGAGSIMVIKIGWTRGSTDRSKTGAAALARATVPSVVLPVTAGIS